MISDRRIALLGVVVLVMVALPGAANQAQAAAGTVKVFILAG